MPKKQKTMVERVMLAATKENQINPTVLRKRLRIYSGDMDNTKFNGSVMRTVRKLASDGMLKKVDVSTFTITKKGQKAFA